MFEKITPEQAGISSAYVNAFISALEKRRIHMHSVLLMKGEKLFAEYYWAPFNKDLPHRMYSETKSYVAIAIGLLLDEGKLSLDDKIADYFPEKIDTPIAKTLKNQTVREMLTMTTVGYGSPWFDSSDRDRIHLYLNRARTIRPSGTIWEYDSAGSQVLCALVEKLSKKRLFDYLNEKIFTHLGTFTNATILSTPSGESWGDSSLLCTSRDMASFGRFVMNYGEWHGKRLLSEGFLRIATSKLVDNTETDHINIMDHGYGYLIWRTEMNGFAFVGMGDQLTVCLPDLDLIFVCTADNQGSPFSRNYIVSNFMDLIASNMQNSALEPNKEEYEKLCLSTQGLELFAVSGAPDSPMRDELDGVKYICEENELNIKEFSFHFDSADSGELRYINANGEMCLPFFVNKNRFGLFPELGYSQDVGGQRTTDGSRYKDAVSFAWLQDNKIRIFVQIIDRYLGNASLTFAFNGDDATVCFYKTAEDFLWNYNGQATAHKQK
ncbi:MAG: serine hydrolase [Clostridia bacterium]|nr:serine hydrolase [Clostridia bacterium]